MHAHAYTYVRTQVHSIGRMLNDPTQHITQSYEHHSTRKTHTHKHKKDTHTHIVRFTPRVQMAHKVHLTLIAQVTETHKNTHRALGSPTDLYVTTLHQQLAAQPIHGCSVTRTSSLHGHGEYRCAMLFRALCRSVRCAVLCAIICLA
jgi:hypothetical protein